MVFLTSIDILDTGFLTVTGRTNQLSTANRVNSGGALRLKGIELEIGSSANLDDETYSGESNEIECPLISVNADTFQMTIFLNSTANATTPGVWSTGDMKYLSALLSLPKTRGFKALYYPVDAASAATIRNHNRQMSYYLGRTDTTEAQGDIDLTLATTNTVTAGSKDLTDIKYIAVRFKDCKITQGPDTRIMVVLTGVLTI